MHDGLALNALSALRQRANQGPRCLIRARTYMSSGLDRQHKHGCCRCCTAAAAAWPGSADERGPTRTPAPAVLLLLLPSLLQLPSRKAMLMNLAWAVADLPQRPISCPILSCALQANPAHVAVSIHCYGTQQTGLAATWSLGAPKCNVMTLL